MCLKSMSLQIDGKRAFSNGRIRIKVDELEKEISEGRANINDLRDEYGRLVTISANKVFNKAGEIKTELLES